jgi:hypothetical protein
VGVKRTERSVRGLRGGPSCGSNSRMDARARAGRTPWSFALRVVAHAAMAWLGLSVGLTGWAWAATPLGIEAAAASAPAIAYEGSPLASSAEPDWATESGEATRECSADEAPFPSQGSVRLLRSDDSEPRAVGLSGDAGESRLAPAVVVPVSERLRVESGCHGLEVGRSCLTFGPRGWVAAERESHPSASGTQAPHAHLDALLDAHLPPVLLPEAPALFQAWLEALVPPALGRTHSGWAPLASLDRPPRG